jgi:hypothetical protein
MVEAGIGIPIVHDKYSYCHGRSTLGVNYNGIAVYYNRNTEFDREQFVLCRKIRNDTTLS